MWKVLLILVLLVVAGHFAVRYLRTNPLDPVVQGGEVVVQTNEYEVHFAREGPADGVYLVANAKSEDYTNQPQNASVSVIDFATARSYFTAYPDFRHYGLPAGLQLDNVSSKLALLASNRIAYGNLLHMLDVYQERADKGGERLCVRISGEALSLTSAVDLDDGDDHTGTFQSSFESQRAVLAKTIDVDDCSALVAHG